MVQVSEPSGGLLLFIGAINAVCVALNFPAWRDSLPCGLGDVESNGLLSHDLPPQLSEFAPNLVSYADYLSGNKLDNNLTNLRAFAFDTPSTSLGVLTSRDSMVVLFVLVLILRQIKSLALPTI